MFYHLECRMCAHRVQAPVGAVGEDNPDGKACAGTPDCTGTYDYRRYSPRTARAGEPVTTVILNREMLYSARTIAIKSRAALKRKAPVDEPESDDEPERPRRRVKVDRDGGDYAPAASHSVDQRLTLASYGDPGPDSAQNYARMMTEASQAGGLYERSSAIHRVKAGVARKGGASVMGDTAAQVAEAAGFRLKKPTLAGGSKAGHAWEWLHLIARCVGGGSVTHNFVAGSFSANTFMEVIEHFVQGRTDLAVRITSYGRHSRVANWIKYEIFRVQDRTTGKPVVERKWETMIDAHTLGFSKGDLKNLQASLKATFGV